MLMRGLHTSPDEKFRGIFVQHRSIDSDGEASIGTS